MIPHREAPVEPPSHLRTPVDAALARQGPHKGSCSWHLLVGRWLDFFDAPRLGQRQTGLATPGPMVLTVLLPQELLDSPKRKCDVT